MPNHFSRPPRRFHLFGAALIVCSLFGSLTLAAAYGQHQRRGPERQKSRRGQPTARAARTPADAIARPLVYESNAAGDLFRSGDVFVRATANSHMTVPIGMSKGAPVLVEFQADDPLYSFHEGNAKIAYVNCGQAPDGASAQVPRQCLMRPTDPLVLQPGEQFIAPTKGESIVPTTVITVQRVSGMVISFVIYPVPDPSQNANRVVVSYDLKKVLEARQQAGLLTQLVSPSELAQSGVPVTSPLVTPSPLPAVASTPAPAKAAGPAPVIVPDELPGAAPQLDAPTPADAIEEKTVAEIERTASRHLDLHFLKPVHGLQLAVLIAPPPVENITVQVIAVRNVTNAPLRLLPDQPELRILQAAKPGAAVLDQTLQVKHVATTVGNDNVLQPNVVYFFAIAYEPPALGVKQSLYASFAHMLAADEPASAPLTFQLAAAH